MAKREEGKFNDGVLLMSQLAAQSAADLAHTTNQLHQNALAQALSMGESLLMLWHQVNRAQEKGVPRRVDDALAMIDPNQVANSLQHIQSMLKKYEEAGL